MAAVRPRPPPRQQPSSSTPPPPPASATDNERSAAEIRAVDCNLSALCEHVQTEGFASGAFSDVVVEATMGSTYHLHRLILSRSSYFRNMLHGPWREAGAPTIILQIDDANVNSEAISMALAYLYGHHPKLDDSNAFRVLAAASFLDLQDLCGICTDYIISELWTSNFLAYQVFAESQDYGVHGERVRNACWGYLCQSAAMELREVLPKLSSQTIHALLTSDELWVPNEEKRFELALYVLLARGALTEIDNTNQENAISEMEVTRYSSSLNRDNMVNNVCDGPLLESEMQQLSVGNNLEGHVAAKNILVELADCVVDFHREVPYHRPAQVQQASCSQTILDVKCSSEVENTTLNSLTELHGSRACCTYFEMQNDSETSVTTGNKEPIEGPCGESTSYHLNGNWLPNVQPKDPYMESSSTGGIMPNDWGRSSMPPLWGGRIVGRRQVKSANKNCIVRTEDYDAFIDIFEGGSLLYCNMSFEALLNVRKQLEELGFPCKAVNDGLWLQMLLCHRVQAVVADTCKSCCRRSSLCECRQSFVYSHGGTLIGSYRHEQERSNSHGNIGNIYLTDTQGEESGLYGPVRVHVRGVVDGLAGIGRGTTSIPGAAWPPTRYVFSRVPLGLGNRNGQQSLGNDETEARVDINGDLTGDGLTAVVGLSQGNSIAHLHAEQTERAFESGASGFPVQILEQQENVTTLEWESAEDSSISLDMNTPLRHFPPFRFGVAFEDVHGLADGQVKHSPEVFYAGSLWKISVQAFSDEDPQGRRTLGLFLHRRKAELMDPLRKVHMYVDLREKVAARYQLICPSKREIIFKHPGKLLPKAPKGWGWRTALFFDELDDLLQGGALRIAAVVQLV